ncbi:adenylyltransferase/cytidyltransferase family protein [Butyrivibrio sp. VCB2006]|uniref:adenylyltransferase/cytidyltransferase family protein n=1 Tax=Butyrivibrio sp. VCB2006 TaxID=1280679 RepID=UPI00041AADE5|nr:adenylyltransferase/cytidyltransferase family protein [Butyrivibrio sp. VCB2006]
MLGRYDNIKKTSAYKLKWYMDLFQITDVALCDDSLKEKLIFGYIKTVLGMAGIKIHMCSVERVKSRENTQLSTLYIASEASLEIIAGKGLNAMSTTDFVDLFRLEDERLVRKTQVYNTLENCYSSICVVGDSAFAKEMKGYYRDNKSVNVRLMDRSAISFDNKCYHLNAEPNVDELVMVMDPIPQFDVVYGDTDKKANAFFVDNMFRSFYKPVETYRADIEHILKRLQDNGVTVVTVCSVDYNDFKGDKDLVATIDSWNELRKKNSEEFNRKRHEARGTTYLLPNQKSLTHSYVKGYSQMHGNGEYINFLNGFRVTTGNKAGAKHDIYMFGACVVRDLGADDDNTLASLIKKEIGDDYNVHNYGSEIHATNLIMRTLDYKPGDVVIWWSLDSIKKQNKIFPDSHYCDLTGAYRRVPELHKHIFDDINHYDRTVKNEVVKEIVSAVKEAVKFDAEQTKAATLDTSFNSKSYVSFGKLPKRIPGKELNADSSFIKYLDELSTNKRSGKKGAIVMNCNPFTLGHRYLIETAAQKVDYLYVFVVEEDKSVFKFKDRFEMVKQGTADLPNVEVLPSGKYVLSAQTLPGYFNKSELKDTYLNASDDLELFMQVAETLGISVRFVGEEPIDLYTRQYNDNMRKILPKYGLEFVEIPRKTVETGTDVVISASRVRKLIEEKDYEGVKKIVPETTYRYLADVLQLVEG